jgi:GNAT superfamily N-acetyltransferase
MINIRKANTEDVATIQQISETTWWPTYEPIVGAEQVRYMLDRFYSTEVLNRQIANDEQTFIILTEDEKPVGFAAYSPRTENTDIYKLHKLYCLPQTQGKGYGKMMVQYVEQSVTDAGKHILELNVNRHNNARDFYLRMGFAQAYDEDIEIGNGFFMNDHVLRKEL